MTENRESFFRRLAPFLAPSVIQEVELAYTLAKYGHRQQLRKELSEDGNPIRYFEHVRRSAIVLIEEAQIVDAPTIISLLLHDVVEDAPNLPPALIERFLGTEVVTTVKTVSKDPKEGYLERFFMSTNWRAYLVKACDRLDNLRSMGSCGPEFRKKQVAETREKYYPLFDRMVELVPTELRPRAQRLRDLVRAECERQATLLEVVGLLST